MIRMVYFGTDGCATCGRKDPGHARWCRDVRAALATPYGRRRFQQALGVQVAPRRPTWRRREAMPRLGRIA